MISGRTTGLEYTSTGFFDENYEKTLSTCIKFDNRNKITRKIGLVPIYSIGTINPNRTRRPDVEEIPCLEDVMSFLYSVHLGARRVTPSFSNTYLDKPEKTFMHASYKPSLILDSKTAYHTASYCNYYIMKKLDDKIGILEEVYREYRFVQANLARLLSLAIENWEKEAKGEKEPHHIERKKGDNKIQKIPITEKEYKALKNVLKNDDRIICFLEGVAILCCWHDHTFSSSNSKAQKMRKWYDEWQKFDAVEQSPEKFCEEDNIRLICEIGRMNCDTCYVIPRGTDIIVDIMKDKENDGKYCAYIYTSENKRHKVDNSNLDLELDPSGGTDYKEQSDSDMYGEYGTNQEQYESDDDMEEDETSSDDDDW